MFLLFVNDFVSFFELVEVCLVFCVVWCYIGGKSVFFFMSFILYNCSFLSSWLYEKLSSLGRGVLNLYIELTFFYFLSEDFNKAVLSISFVLCFNCIVEVEFYRFNIFICFIEIGGSRRFYLFFLVELKMEESTYLVLVVLTWEILANIAECFLLI